MGHYFRVYLFIIILTITGCQSAIPDPIGAIPSATKKNTPVTISPTITFPPLTQTPKVISTPTVSFTPTTIQPTPMPIQACQDYGKPMKVPEQFGFDGVILYEDLNLDRYRIVGGTPLISSNLTISGIPNNSNLIMYGFSPDGDWLAFQTGGGLEASRTHRSVINLWSYQGKLLTNVVDFEMFKSLILGDILIGWNIDYWINGELMYSEIFNTIKGATTFVSNYSVLNPFSGEWRHEMVNMLSADAWSDGFAYSPDLSRTLFMREGSLVLADEVNQSDLWTISDFNLSTSNNLVARWSQDSSKVAYWSGSPDSFDKNIFVADRDGLENEDITAGLSQFMLENYTAMSFQWSTDNHRLALSIKKQNNDPTRYTLYIYNTSTHRFTYQCPLYVTEGDVKLYWSPNNRYIAYSATYNRPSLNIIDLQTGLVYSIADNSIVFGWSDKFQSK
jgi:hypothetical protein